MVTTGAPLGSTGWRLVGLATGSASCEHCNRALKYLYRVVNPAGEEMVVGRGCVKKLTGWTLEAAHAARLLRIAERDARRATTWAQFTQDHPAAAAQIEADIAAYDRGASPGASAGASDEIHDWIADRYTDYPEWTLDRLAVYQRRRQDFWWVTSPR
jgi:hypothetical protein